MADRPTGTRAAMGNNPEGTRTQPAYAPVADIHETDDALVLVVEVPGVKPGEVDVSLDKRVLTIAGHGAAQRREGYSLALCEYRSGNFERSFTLSDMIDDNAIEAVMKDGVLRLTLPKAKAGPAKVISVKAG